jgi:hypothetical protein
MTTPEDKKIEGTIPVLALLSEKTGWVGVASLTFIERFYIREN